MLKKKINGTVARSSSEEQLEAQQNIPLKQMYLISAIKSILYQSQMIVWSPESTQLNRNIYAKSQDSSQDQNQNSKRKLSATLAETSQTTEAYCRNLATSEANKQDKKKGGS